MKFYIVIDIMFIYFCMVFFKFNMSFNMFDKVVDV